MAIVIQNIIKGFGDKQVLKGISLRLEQGKVNMIIGASGSGKSVMLKCIVGLMKPDGGSIKYDDVDFLSANFKEVRELRKNMGMLFQYSALFDSMTVEENVGFPLKLYTKLSAKEIKKQVQSCLDRVNMTGTNHLFPAELSGGMMKRVGIARAIVLNPKYLFCDEPNSGLDPLTSKVIDELIQDITAEYNTCTVVVSHDMNSVINISDNIMFLHKGQKEWEGDKRAIMHSGNDSLDKFVFVSDLINRDLFANGPTAPKNIELAKEKAESPVEAPKVEVTAAVDPVVESTPIVNPVAENEPSEPHSEELPEIQKSPEEEIDPSSDVPPGDD
jgi:phospholipid/cholesterol/gamma-HCH transport system ATP-binding protein